MVGILDILKLADTVDKKQKKEAKKREIMERVMSFDDPAEDKKVEKEKPKKSVWGKKTEDEKK